MRLINVNTFQIGEFVGTGFIPPYAILSHTWETEEVTFQDWQDMSRASTKRGYAKICLACHQAIKDGLEYLWVDTNCIDKTSSAELSEAINSMFAWYRNAACCYVYLADTPQTAARLNSKGQVDKDDPFCQSKWFTRGWTLQELLAPFDLVFFSSDWVRIGTKIDLKTTLSQITGVEARFLTGELDLSLASVAKRMSWISKRATTRLEDIAYCMLGIFDINMPLLYGEGLRAFGRLQEEILKSNDDQSLFCWEWNRSRVPDGWASILAPSTSVFEHSAPFHPTSWDDDSEVMPYTITNSGLSIKMPFIQTANENFLCGILQVRLEWEPGSEDPTQNYTKQVCIPLENARLYRRLPFPTRPFSLNLALAGEEKSIHIISRPKHPAVSRGYFTVGHELPTLFNLPTIDSGFLLITEQDSTILHMAYCTPGVIFMERQSVLGVDFGGLNVGEDFAAGILTVRHHTNPASASFILLAIRLRKTASGIPKIHFYCQVVSREMLGWEEREQRHVHVQQLQNIVTQAARESSKIMHDADFSSHDEVSVALGNIIHYSSSPDGSRQFVRVAQIVSDACDNDVLRELKADTPLGVSLLMPSFPAIDPCIYSEDDA
jgi:hypothetical protein